MSADGRQLSVYDGQRLLGFVIEHADRTCFAKDASGHKLGKFESVQKAAAAIGEVDKTFNARSQAEQNG